MPEVPQEPSSLHHLPLTPLTRAFMLPRLLNSPGAAVSRARAGKGWEPGTCQDPEAQSWVLGL